MATQKGIVQIKGQLDDFSFYPSVFGNIVRRKGGASKEKIRKDPAFKRLREHQSEFKNCAAAGKLLRGALRVYTLNSADFTLVWRVTQLMNAIKNEDKVSARGKRQVIIGMVSKVGKALLNGFDFNSKAPLKQVLNKTVSAGAGKVSIKNFAPKLDLIAPKGATHVSIVAIVSKIDFKANTHLVKDKAQVLALDLAKSDVVLNVGLPAGNGTLVYLVQVQFLQLVNGTYAPLQNKEGNAFAVIRVE